MSEGTPQSSETPQPQEDPKLIYLNDFVRNIALDFEAYIRNPDLAKHQEWAMKDIQKKIGRLKAEIETDRFDEITKTKLTLYVAQLEFLHTTYLLPPSESINREKGLKEVADALACIDDAILDYYQRFIPKDKP